MKRLKLLIASTLVTICTTGTTAFALGLKCTSKEIGSTMDFGTDTVVMYQDGEYVSRVQIQHIHQNEQLDTLTIALGRQLEGAAALIIRYWSDGTRHKTAAFTMDEGKSYIPFVCELN